MSIGPHERRFHGDADRLRSPERIALLEIDRVVALSLEEAHVSRLLDVGTGTGVFAEAFTAKGVEVSAVDTNPKLLEKAKSLVPAVTFKAGQAEDLPFGNSSFDLAFLGHVLHETDDPVKALQEARRVSTVRVVILEWPYVDEEHGPPLAHRVAPETMLAMAARAGLGEVEHLRLTHMDLYRMAVAP